MVVELPTREIGSYKFHIIAQDNSGTKRTPDLTFEVIASDNRGFLRVSKNDARFFEFDNGEPYFGIGRAGGSEILIICLEVTPGGSPLRYLINIIKKRQKPVQTSIIALLNFLADFIYREVT